MPEGPQEMPAASPDQGTPEHEAAMAELEQRAAEALAREVTGTPPPEPPAAPADEEA